MIKEPDEINEQKRDETLGLEWRARWNRQTAGAHGYYHFNGGGKRVFWGTPADVEAEIRKIHDEAEAAE